MSQAFRRLPQAEARWVERHAAIRDRLRRALVERAAGQARMHVAGGVGAALAPDGPRAADWQAEILRRQAAGMDAAMAAARQAAFMRHQVRRAASKLIDGD